MKRNAYPLGHSADEIGRLELQAKLLHDPLLDELAANASSCLEIGVGSGANWSLLRGASPALQFFGIDNSEEAIRRARASHGDSGAIFDTMSAAELVFCDESFDLVFSKLVLWAIGPRWNQAVREAFRVLKRGGVFYAFEPFDKGLLFQPPRPTLESLVAQWDEGTIGAGMDPFIGPKLPQAFHEAGFEQVSAKSFPVLALSQEKERYFAVCDNLRKFYFGDSSSNPLATSDTRIREQALTELFSSAPGSLVMDQFFVTWGRKPIR